MTGLLLHGNSWGLITGRDGYGYPTGIEWIPPDRVDVQDDPQQPWNTMRTRVYVEGRLIGNWREELFHVKGYALPGRTEGISPLRAFAMTVMSGLEAGKYGTDWFAAGGFPSGVFKNELLEVSAEDAAEIRETLMSAIHGHKPLVIGRDWDYKPVSVPPSEAAFIEAMQMNATQLAAVFGLPPDRVGGRRGDSLTYNCLSLDTDILSTRGWLRYDQVAAGDICLTLNTETGLAEWQPVTSVHVFSDGPYPVVEMESQGHSSASTYDHRWPVTYSASRGKPGWHWRTTETLTSDARISAAVPVVAPAEAKWSDALVELVAWLWTEGWISDTGAVTLTQSDTVNPDNVARIRAALTELFGASAAERGVSLLGGRGWQKRELIRAELLRNPAGTNRGIARTCGSDAHTVRNLRQGLIGQHNNGPGWQEDRDGRGIVHFRLNLHAGRVLTEHAPGKVVATEFLSQLTRAQLELFYQTSIDADGCRVTGLDRDRTQIGQKDKARLEAFQVACALTGRSAVIPQRPNVSGMYYMSIYASAWRKPAGHLSQVSRGTVPGVWCVQTPNKSWFARRNGTCYFTGNTVEQSTLQVIEALRPWMVRLETAFFNLLPANRFVRFNADALLKTDLKTRTEIYAQQRAIGLRSIDELRDSEDLPPLPGIAGAENIPLEVMVAMGRSVRAIPKSMLGSIELEMDLLVDRLEKLQAEGLAGPDMEPSVGSPTKVLGGSIGNVRSLGDISTDDLIELLRGVIAAREQRKAAQPEYVGPWVPREEDLARIASANGNGNGRAH